MKMLKYLGAVVMVLLMSLVFGAYRPAQAAKRASANPYLTQIQALLLNLQANGYNSSSSVNNGLGGLWINWRPGDAAGQVNFSGSGLPDPTVGQSPRHDRLTDLRFLNDMVKFRAQSPQNTKFNQTIAQYTAIVKAEFQSADDRGWTYDIFASLARLTGDSWYTNMQRSLAQYYDEKLYKPAYGMAFKVDSQHPLGYYRVDWAIEQGGALIEAGKQFGNQRWIADGTSIINFVFAHAYVAKYHTLFYQMTNVLNSDGTINANEQIDRTESNNGGRVVIGEVSQEIVSLANAYWASSDNRTILHEALDLLDALTASQNTLGMWDSVNLGYFMQVTFSGPDAKHPGDPMLSAGKKEAGRQDGMLEAFIVGNGLQKGRYTQMQSAMEQVVLKSLYTVNGWTGVPYEVLPTWGLYPNRGSSTRVEDWQSSEATDIAAEALLTLIKM